MVELGQTLLIGAFIVAVLGVVLALRGARPGGQLHAAAARNSMLGLTALLTFAVAVLTTSFLRHDFSVKYVAEHSNRDMPTALVGAALYSGMEGSLLYWSWTLSLLGSLAAWTVWRNRSAVAQALAPYLIATLLFVQAFFAFLMAFVARPFVRFPGPIPADGQGLNPLLRDWGMLVHPPMLLAGYMSWTVPFAFAIAALASGRVGNEWLPLVRKWALIAWAILGVGNLLGAWWAYHVLGWGGYWGWDPVENSAIMPWLAGTAFIHSIQVQERRGTLKLWNMGLVLLTFTLSIFGTFVVRSGILTSVHSFAQSSIGPFYFAFLTIVLLGSVALLFWRMPALRVQRDLDSLVSRESAFLLNNLLFLALTFAIFWGTIFPLISEALQGLKVSVGAPYFQRVNGPLLLALVALMGIGPLLPWRRASGRQLRAAFVAPLVAAAVLTALAAAAGIREPAALVGIFVSLFTAATIVEEFVRGTRARRGSTGEGLLAALWALPRRNGRRYGGYIIHLGIVGMALAILGSQLYHVEHQVTLTPGQAVGVGRYVIQFQSRSEYVEADRKVDEALLLVMENGRLVGELRPTKSAYRGFEAQATTSVAIRTTALEDLYVVLNGWDSQSASFLIVVNPLVVWLWIGGAVVVAGTVLTLWPRPLPQTVREAARPRAGAVAYGD